MSRCLPKRSKTILDVDGPARHGGIVAFGPAVQGLCQLRVSENALRYVEPLVFSHILAHQPATGVDARASLADGRRPFCGACEGRKQRCRGYRRDEFVFMSDGWRAPGVSSRLANDPPGAATQRQRRRCTGGQGVPPLPPTSRQSRRNEMSPAHEDCRDDDASSIVPSRPLTPEPMAICVSFFLSQFTPNPPRAVRVMIQNCRRYLGQLLDRPLPGGTESNIVHPHPATDAAEALVMTYFGRQHGSDLLIRESIRSYARALKSLSLKLDEVQSIGLVSVDEDEWRHLVFSCLFLTFWEVSGKPATRRHLTIWFTISANMKGKLVMHPNGTAWQKHVRGLASLIEGRGPQGFHSPTSLELVAMLRMLVVSPLSHSTNDGSYLTASCASCWNQSPQSAALFSLGKTGKLFEAPGPALWPPPPNPSSNRPN